MLRLWRLLQKLLSGLLLYELWSWLWLLLERPIIWFLRHKAPSIPHWSSYSQYPSLLLTQHSLSIIPFPFCPQSSINYSLVRCESQGYNLLPQREVQTSLKLPCLISIIFYKLTGITSQLLKSSHILRDRHPSLSKTKKLWYLVVAKSYHQFKAMQNLIIIV